MARAKQVRSTKPGNAKALDLDVDQLERIAQLHCTIAEAATMLGCSERSLKHLLSPSKNTKPQYREAWERGKQSGKMSLRRLQWAHANGKGSSAVTMTIHLSKHWLGETDKSLVEHAGDIGISVSVLKDEANL